MYSRDETRRYESNSSVLCLSCGLCCQGLIFNRAALLHDEIKLAEDMNLEYFCADDGELAFRLPCHIYQNDRCSMYHSRLDARKRYQCLLLKRLNNGDLDLDKGRKIVMQAESLMDTINRQLDDINITATDDFRQRIAGFLNLQYKNPMIGWGSANGLLGEIEDFIGCCIKT
ncbi:Uncharacterised protein [uncultured archaeon]|nr:Uncharacterised protein [uncultured archaeon]